MSLAGSGKTTPALESQAHGNSAHFKKIGSAVFIFSQ
jgi:hypothetical protein